MVIAHCQNSQCTSTTQITADHIETHGDFRWLEASVAIGADGLGIVSYYDYTNANLKVTHCADIACTSLTNVTNVDEFGDVGQFNSLTIGVDGLPLITYRDWDDRAVKAAHCGDVACALPLQAPFIVKSH